MDERLSGQKTKDRSKAKRPRPGLLEKKAQFLNASIWMKSFTSSLTAGMA